MIEEVCVYERRFTETASEFRQRYLTDGDDECRQQEDSYRHPGDVGLQPPLLGKVTPALKLSGSHFRAREDKHLIRPTTKKKKKRKA